MKKFKLTALALATVMFLGACNTANEDEGGKKSGQDSEKTTKEAEDVGFEYPELPKGDGSEVIVWNRIFEDWNQEHFEQQAEKYNSLDRGYTVKQEFVPEDAWADKLLTSQATGETPDTYIAAYNHIYGHVDNDEILPLDDIFAKEQLDDILPNVREMVTFNDKVWAYPQLVEPSTVLFYRTDKFKEVGIKEVPKTWADFIAAAEKLKKLTDENTFVLGIPGFGVEMSWSTWGWQMGAAGHLAINDEWSEPTLDQGYLDLANFWGELYSKGLVPEQPLGAYNDIAAYGDEALFMQFTGSWAIAQLINDYPEIYEKTGVAVPPTKDGSSDSVVATNGGWTYVIDAKTKNKDGAYNYISWLLAEDPATPAEFFDVAKYSKAAPRKSVSEYINSKGVAPDHADIINTIASRAVSEANYSWNISMEVAGLFEDVALRGEDAAKAAEKRSESIKKIIEDEKIQGKNPRA